MRAREIAELVNGILLGDPDIDVNSIAEIVSAQSGQLAFYEKDGPLPLTNASCVVVSEKHKGLPLPENTSYILVKNPKLAFAIIGDRLRPKKHRDPGIHPSSVISTTAYIGEGVSVGAFGVVGDNARVGNDTIIHAGVKVGTNVTIGKNCVLHPNVSIEDDCTIGDNVILHAGVVIGADGFGYVKDETGKYIKFPQIGTVVIEDNVEIGANTCIDRGALGETRIGKGTKIDNLVQVGHNVQIGKRCVIAAQTGISGSVVIEDDCVIGGQVGFGDHVRVQSGAIIGSQAGVLPGKIVRPGVWWGTPIQPLDEYKRQNARVKGLARLKDEIDRLKKKLADQQEN